MVYQKVLAPKTSLTPTPIISPSLAPGPTANWKTFQSKLFNYSIKFPLNWYVIGNDKNNAPDEISSCDRQNNIYCEREKNQISINISNWESNDVTLEKSYEEQTDRISNITKPTEETVDGERAIRYSVTFSEKTDSEGVAFVGDRIIVKHKNRTYFIKFFINAGAKSDNLDDARLIFDQILSTFKFLD